MAPDTRSRIREPIEELTEAPPSTRSPARVIRTEAYLPPGSAPLGSLIVKLITFSPLAGTVNLLGEMVIQRASEKLVVGAFGSSIRLMAPVSPWATKSLAFACRRTSALSLLSIFILSLIVSPGFPKTSNFGGEMVKESARALGAFTSAARIPKATMPTARKWRVRTM